MPSILLNIATRYLGPLLLLLSLLVLYRGHNFPGGGFIGGLVAAAAVLLYALAHGWPTVERRLPFTPISLMAAGLGLALFSGLPGLFAGQDFMAGQWLPALQVPLLGKLKLGTPLLFDVGVYLTVVGFTVKSAHSLAAESS